VPPKFSISLQALCGDHVSDETPDTEPGTPPPVAFPRLLVDGPYSAPAQDVFRFKVVILIGAGIGVTPFASVIREYLHWCKKERAGQVRAVNMT
jgi:predicted ferric reductase